MEGYSRQQFLRRGAVAAGGIAGLGLLDPVAAFGRSAGDPSPIPGGFAEDFTLVTHDPFFHALPPGYGFEMSTITDLNGVVGGSDIRGTARGSDGTTYTFDTDRRAAAGP